MRCRRGGDVRRTTGRRDARDDEILPEGQDKSALSCVFRECDDEWLGETTWCHFSGNSWE